MLSLCVTAQEEFSKENCYLCKREHLSHVLVTSSTGLADATPGGSGGLDLSEFPALANRSRLESLSRVEGVPRLDSIGGVSAPPSSLPNRPSYGVVSKPAEPPPDFSIHNEDFPALPGSNTFKSGNFYRRVHVIECCKRESKVNATDY